MPGSSAVIEILNEALTAELTAINQYFLHSKMCANWGYGRLAERFNSDAIAEMKDAEVLIDRILFLGGAPNMHRLSRIAVGESVVEQLEADLELEKAATERYNRGIAVCVAEGDNGSRELLDALLKGEEEHIDFLDRQLELIRQIGLENYLTQQIHG